MQNTEPWYNIFSEIAAFILKHGAIIGMIILGTMSNLAAKILLKKRITLLQSVAVLILSIFAGVIVSMWCYYQGWLDVKEDKLPIGFVIVPAASIFGEYIITYLIANYKTIMDRIVNVFFSRVEKKND